MLERRRVDFRIGAAKCYLFAQRKLLGIGQHPDVRSEIQHLVEIGNVAILHDQVWLTRESRPSDVVEIFICDESGLIVKVDVVQPSS